MCTCPNYMVWNGQYTNNDKPKLTFIGHHQFNDMLRQQFPYVQVPCGKCLECRIQHARSWADRCVLEAKKHEHNYFVTLTYDDEHLPAKNSLCPDDMTKFIKRLRKHFEPIKIRFLYSGEYGDTSWRPHYHILLFGCPLDDLSYNFKLMEDGKLVNHLRPPKASSSLMFSETIYKLWQYKGMISVDEFNYNTAAYVSQYVTKKCNPNNEKLYKELGIVPEFIRMSRHPGIGGDYFDDHLDMHNIGHLIIPGDGNAHVVKIPRYYDKLFIKKYGEDVFEPIQRKRVKQRFKNIKTYLHSGTNKDVDNDIRNYNLIKRKRERASL